MWSSSSPLWSPSVMSALHRCVERYGDLPLAESVPRCLQSFDCEYEGKERFSYQQLKHQFTHLIYQHQQQRLHHQAHGNVYPPHLTTASIKHPYAHLVAPLTPPCSSSSSLSSSLGQADSFSPPHSSDNQPEEMKKESDSDDSSMMDEDWGDDGKYDDEMEQGDDVDQPVKREGDEGGMDGVSLAQSPLSSAELFQPLCLMDTLTSSVSIRVWRLQEEERRARVERRRRVWRSRCSRWMAWLWWWTWHLLIVVIAATVTLLVHDDIKRPEALEMNGAVTGDFSAAVSLSAAAAVMRERVQLMLQSVMDGVAGLFGS